MADASIPDRQEPEEVTDTAEAIRALARRVGGVYGSDSKLLFDAADEMDWKSKQLRAREEALNKALFAPGTMGCHEAFHVASILAEMVEERLCAHPSIILCEPWAALAKRAADALQLLYSDIGEAHCK